MQSKIIYLPQGFFERQKQLTLTPSMIDTLLAAYEKQKEKIRFGPCDIKRSCTSLINRGLIIRKEVCENEIREWVWQVTNEALIILKTMGYEVSI